ncbi:LOW QUALITY PROTEIN: toll-like receptor 2 [Simochromis diagramma]|uniref:LOW QUALITY PROTEIN: toll-like receptor 2 n=1 Tax=Simochromis diagramma TaxID=43689 RepID=UPI001A7E3C6A|nr:LOW QUALITY PROTEIN: toll-like receptor 2 [Simochromis diagramma]
MKFLVFVLLVSQCSSLTSQQCHHCEQTSCDCSSQNLREVPAAASKLITELDLSLNALETIMKDDFLSYAALRALFVNNNRIKTIHEDAFHPLTHLEKLDLSSNQLETLSSGWFQNLISLHYLNLLGNKYSTLGQGNLFLPLRSLKTLHFGGPFLQSVSKRDFSGLFGLEQLVFEGNHLQVFNRGSLRQIGPISHVTLSLNGVFQRDLAVVRAILLDVVHPNTTVTFTDTQFENSLQMFPLHVAIERGATGLSFKNVNMSVSACVQLVNILSGSELTSVAIEDSQFFEDEDEVFLVDINLKGLEVIFLRNIDIVWFYRFPELSFMQNMLTVVRRASVINSKVFVIPCQSIIHFTNLEFLDISDNTVTDRAFMEMMCYGKEDVLLNLHTLNISRNRLFLINSELFTKLEKLENLDMSRNSFDSMPSTCSWPASLKFLNLSSTSLPEVTSCLPQSLQILDLSRNKLTVFNIELPLLKELYISGNKLGNLPDGHLYVSLAVLSIQDNNLAKFSSKNLHDYQSLRVLEAAGNPYVCSCDFVGFVTNDLMKQEAVVRHDLKSYICDSPDAVRGERVSDVKLSVFECHTALAISLLCLGILVLCVLIAGLCYKFSVVWYMKMTWAWLKAKRKPKLKKGVLQYDAFVSYSEMDSGWVEAHLIPALEQSEPPLRLCLHKRDFVPGGWIVDNIMDAIEKSHRTLFVLSQNFVRSEWCKYELDYTHFRLFDQNDDAVVLILLEPIDKNNIPKKFIRLRKVMNSRTYLEWPDDEDQIPAFWQSLRTAIETPEIDDTNNL